MDIDTIRQYLPTEIMTLMVAAVVILVIAYLKRRTRMMVEDPGPLENLLFAGGILLGLASLILVGYRGCTGDIQDDSLEKENKELPAYSQEAPGCSKPKKDGIKDFEK